MGRTPKSARDFIMVLSFGESLFWVMFVEKLS